MIIIRIPQKNYKKQAAMKRCSKQERRVIRRQLLTYCGMDTYAEYVLLHALIALAKEKEADRPE